MYKNYIFDLYGTLVDIRTNENKPYLWEKMSEIFGFYGADYSRAELKRAYFKYCGDLESVARKTDEFAEIDLDIVFRKLFSDKGIEIDQSTLCAVEMFVRSLSTRFIRLYDGVEEFLQALKDNGKSVFLLSNAQRGFTRPELKLLGIEKYFDGIMISSEEGFKKPSEKFFRRLLNKYNLDSKESIMIGNDAGSDIAGAISVGMDSLYIHTEISPEFPENLQSTYSVPDGDFTKIKALILTVGSHTKH